MSKSIIVLNVEGATDDELKEEASRISGEQSRRRDAERYAAQRNMAGSVWRSREEATDFRGRDYKQVKVPYFRWLKVIRVQPNGMLRVAIFSYNPVEKRAEVAEYSYWNLDGMGYEQVHTRSFIAAWKRFKRCLVTRAL